MLAVVIALCVITLSTFPLPGLVPAAWAQQGEPASAEPPTPVETAAQGLPAPRPVPQPSPAPGAAPAAAAGAAQATVQSVAPTYDGPSVTAPETMARDTQGRVAVRAIRLDSPLRVDGQLDEALYAATPITSFVQNEPNWGAEATERTEVWISFDRDNVYVSVRAWESEPERMIANEMRRDSNNILENENFAFSFDPYYDRRNGVILQFNPLGGRMDGQVTNESQYNGDWNPVWRVVVARFDGGWTGEAIVPFRSLRYRSGPAQLWGFNARRINRWKNEISYLSQTTRGQGPNGMNRMSESATLVGLDVPQASRLVELKPFAISDIVTDNNVLPRVSNDLGADVGFDFKFGITPNITADFTYNTDFAQVEADEQQVNLTRFNLFFPEKREFFLENQGLFQFGGAAGRGAVPFAFYSRRIGLDAGLAVPILAGGRLTGRVGPFGIGVINVQTEEAGASPASNFSVVRLRRDILRRSSIGAMYTGKTASALGDGGNALFGLDARFAFFQNLTVDTYWAKTETPGLSGDDSSYRVQMQYNHDRYGLTLHRLSVGDNFNPEMGFIFRKDFKKYFAQARFSPRPRNIDAVRKVSWQGQVDYFENPFGQVETRQTQGQFAVELQNSDIFSLVYNDFYDAIDQPFRIAQGVTIPIGSYNYGYFVTSYTLGQQRSVAGTVSLERGSFWDGDRTSLAFNSARVEVNARLAIEPSVSINRVSLPHGAFSTNLVSSRITWGLTPLMFVSSLIQYNSSSSSVDSNVRFRWEYQPGSELFMVYNESRDTLRPGFPGTENRSFIVKINRMFRF